MINFQRNLKRTLRIGVMFRGHLNKRFLLKMENMWFDYSLPWQLHFVKLKTQTFENSFSVQVFDTSLSSWTRGDTLLT